MKKNFTIFKSAMMLICALLVMQFGMAQTTTIAGWTFPTSPGSVSTYPADCGIGDGMLYLDGTNGSDEWTVGTGTSVNNNASFGMTGAAPTIVVCGDENYDKALGMGGVNNNGKSVVFTFSTTSFQNIQLSYDFKRTGTGFNTATWAYSTDGINFTEKTTITDETAYTSANTSRTNYTVDFSDATELNNQTIVYIRLTVDGATAANGNNRYDNINFTGESDVPTTEQPVFSVQAGRYCGAIDVTITSETEGASIYYTTDGSDPDNVNGTLYEAPIHIESTTTLRAKAYADGLAPSYETSAAYTFSPTVATISDFKAFDGDDNFYKLTCPVTVVFQNGNYLFVEDEAHTGLCIYKNGGFSTNFFNGDVITGGICGKTYLYTNSNSGESTLEMSSPEFVNPIPEHGQEVEPVNVTISDLRLNWDMYESRLVTISGVTFDQGSFSTSTSSTLNIHQGTEILGCTNTFGVLNNMEAPVANANVTGITFNNSTLKRIAPRNVNDIEDLLPTLAIVSPNEGQVFEQGNPIPVELSIENFNFENESMIEFQLLLDETPVATRYLHNAEEFTQNSDISSMVTDFGNYTFIASLVNSDNTQFTIPATDTVSFTYNAVYIAIETSVNRLEFTEIGESQTFTATAFRLDENITITVDNSDFTVSPTTLAATAENETVAVTFNGEATATGTLTLTSGTTTATVLLNAVIPIDTLIYGIGFENAEGFICPANFVYDNDAPAYYGPAGQQWGVMHGCVTTTDTISGRQALQMRYYTNSNHNGHLGYTYTNFDLHNVTKVEFSAKSTNNLRLHASFSHNGGESFEGDTVYILSSTPQRFTYFITDSGEYYSVRVKFAVELPEPAPTSTSRLTIDNVNVYGVTGLEPNIVETPVISEASNDFIEPITVSITCATEDARIYYTLDGSTPDESSTLYDNPITINSTCTLKAKAFKGGMDPSNVAFAEYTFPVEVATIADFKAFGANATESTILYKITGNVTFVYRNARNIFIEDATGGLLVYDNNNPVVTNEYEEGDVINGGIIGKYTTYNGMPELIPYINWEPASGTATVTISVVTASDIASDYATYESRLVRINAGVFAEGATFNTSSATNATFTDATGDIVVRNQFKTLDTTVNAGDSVDIIGFAAIYSNNSGTSYQIFPRTNADIIPIVHEPDDTTSTNPEDTVGIRTLAPVILSVYPNPSKDIITVNTDHNGGSLEILNAFGQIVYRATSPVYPMTINLCDKAAGLYFVRVITADNRIAIVKVSKE